MNIKIYDQNYASLADIRWDFENSSQDEISKLHPYPARFIESIPQNLISNLGVKRNEYVFDPFCGSGTTLYEAQKLGFKSFGVDLNPIACLISKVKVSPLPDDFIESAKKVRVSAKERYNNEDYVAPNIPNIDHWFKEDIQKAIYCIVNEIKALDRSDLVDFLNFSLSCIIVRVSNQESDTRYAAIEKNMSGTDVFDSFEKSYIKLYRAKRNAVNSVPSSIITKDILTLSPEEVPGKVGLVVTSPPYPNAYEYWLYHKYRMWWLGYDPIHVREHEIGARPHYMKKNGQTEVDFYMQMDKVFDLFNSILSKDGHVAIVIGRSIIKGREIDNSSIIQTIAANKGYTIKCDIERTISPSNKSFNLKYGKIKKENILIFRKA